MGTLWCKSFGMKITVSEKFPKSVARIIGVSKEACPVKSVSKDAFSGAVKSTYFVHGTEPVLYVGLGEKAKINERLLRQAAGAGVRHYLGMGREQVAFEVSADDLSVQAIVEGAILGAYKFEDFIAKNKRRKHVLKSVALVLPKAGHAAARKVAARALICAEATNLTRQVGNLPPNVLTPEQLGKEAQKLSKAEGLRCKVWTEVALKKEKFGGILAVGQGSENPPRLIRMDYSCGKKSAPTLAVVGKAITFDTGGISLKPGPQMEEMKFDKMGGCAVLGVIQAAARLKLPFNVVGIISSAENMPDGKSYRPGDIVTTWDGQTIEVHNTDAEGRIVLADALAYARDVVKPDFMVDMATLTGACVVALGMSRGGLFTDDERAQCAFFAAGESTGDRVWHLPMGEEYSEMMKSDIATVKNISGGRWGGASSAASFLKNWVGETPWAHLDIAGTAWITSKQEDLDVGATGFGVRLVTDFAERYFDSY